MTIRPSSPEAARELLHSGQEVAFLDVREAAAYGEGHPLLAVHCPYSRLEHDAARLVPDPSTPVILIADSNGLADLAARRLAECGWRDLRPIVDGVRGWEAAGLTLFSGVNVPSKVFGELAESQFHPATIDAATLDAWRGEGRPFHLFDVRPLNEHAKMRIPGSRCLPNGELAHRFAAAVEDPHIPVVVSCAGRTRGLIGALGLELAGVPNPVYALENGTQGWALSGFELERGAKPDAYVPLDAAGQAESRSRALSLIERRALPTIDAAEAADLVGQSGRTTYLFDLRSQDEREDGPVEAAELVIAGQLVQASDQYMAVRHARIILIDTTGLRAAITAIWLRAMGFEPLILIHARGEEVRRPAASWKPKLPPGVRRIAAADALARLASSDATGYDFRPSAAHETDAIAGFRWSNRPALREPADTPRLAVLIGAPEIVALAALDLGERGIEAVHLQDGLDTLPRAAALDPMGPQEAIDRVWFVHDRHDGNLESSRQYLAWETGLLARLDERERAEFL